MKPKKGLVKITPFNDRRCTDILMLLIFLASGVGLIIVLAHASTTGNLDRLLYGMDYMSDLCGQDNSVATTGMPIIVNATFNKPTVWHFINPFGLRPTEYTTEVRRGGRNHTGRRFLYYSFPTGHMDGWESTAVCLDRCPGAADAANGSAPEDPSRWVCTGKYSDGPPAGCPGGQGEASKCVAYRNALFTRVGVDVLNRCNNLLEDCDVCFPPYKSIPLMSYCMPDPRHALESFQTAAVAFGALGAALGNTANGGATAVRGPNGTLSWQEGQGLTTRDLEEMRQFISSAPHLAYEDLRLSQPVICGCILVAFLFGLLWMILLRFFTGLMVWLTLGFIACGFGFSSWWMYERQHWMRSDVRYMSDDLFKHQADTLHVAFWVVAVIGSVYCLLVLCAAKRILIAVRVMKEATKAVAALPLMLLIPLLTLALVLGIVAYAIYVILLLVSSGELEMGRSGFGHLTMGETALGLLCFHCVGTLWLTWWVRHVQHAAVAGAVSQWYFAPDKWRDVGSFPVTGSYYRAIRFHTGSLAMGSLLITLLQIVRFVVLVLVRRLASCKLQNKLCDLCCCCLNCCLGCVERFVKFLSRNAYVQMMISGGSFCSSAADAAALLSKNLIRVAVVRSIGWGFLLLGKLFIAAAAGGVGALFLLTQPPYDEELYSITAPVTIIVICSWMIAVAFMGIYNMTLDTIFVCFCIDQERANQGEPTFASPQLAALIDSNAREEAAAADGAPADAKSGGSAKKQRKGGRLPPEVSTTRQQPTPNPPSSGGDAPGNPFGNEGL